MKKRGYLQPKEMRYTSLGTHGIPGYDFVMNFLCRKQLLSSNRRCSARFCYLRYCGESAVDKENKAVSNSFPN